LVINKIDPIDEEKLIQLVEHWHEIIPQAEIIPLSALKRFNLEPLLKRIKELLPESPPFFDKDALTDKPERFFVTEIVREKILLNYDKEIPYSVEVVVENFKEESKLIRVNAIIYVERESQKGIIIGHQGKALKKVGIEARSELEAFFGKQVFIELFVKVEKDWRNRTLSLRNFGYTPPSE
jgi:GTP-binding protein Era